MRIAFVVTTFPSLSETFVLNQITGLIDLGHEVDIYARNRGDTSNVHPDVIQYELLPRTRHWPWIPHNPLRRRVKSALLFSRHLPARPAALWGCLKSASPECLFWAIPFLDQRPYDAVLCHFGQNGNRAVELREAGVLTGRIVTVFHAADLTRFISTRGPRVYERLFGKGDLFLPISFVWKNRLIELGCPAERIIVHRMGIDCTRFSFRTRRPEGDGAIRLLTVARLVEKKGIEYAIRAIARVARSRARQIEYSVIGDGPLRPQLESIAAECGVPVQFLGGRPQDDVREQLERAHIFLAPSVTASDGDQEGIPVSIIEAMASGLPVLTTHHSGIPELVRAGSSGFLVPERDVGALARCLEDLMDHPGQWAALGEAGRAIIEQEYDIRPLNQRLAELLRGS